MPQCPNCGQLIFTGVKFCGNCGVKLDGTQLSSSIRPACGPTTSIFTGSEYTVQKKIMAVMNTFEIKDSSGDLVARGKKEVVLLGPAYTIETPEGIRIGEMRRKPALLPNRPFLEILDAQGQLLGVIIMRVAKKPGAGFFSIGITSWLIENASGEELAKIDWRKAGHEWTVVAPDGTVIAEVHWKWLEIPRDTYTVKILSPVIDPYFVLATVFGNPADRSNLV